MSTQSKDQEEKQPMAAPVAPGAEGGDLAPTPPPKKERWLPKQDVQEILAMYVPLFVQQASITLMGILISMLVKRNGLEAVGAVNMLEQLNILFQQIFAAMGTGLTVVIATYRGKGDLTRCSRVLNQAIYAAVILAVGIGVIALTCRPMLLGLLLGKSDPAVYDYAATYLTFCLMSYPFLAIHDMVTAAMRGSGKPTISLIITLTNNGSYALFAFLSAVVFQGGVLGVGIAMLCARALAAGVSLYALKRGNEVLTGFRFKFVGFDRALLKPLLFVTIPLCIENILFMFGKLITQTYAVPFGTVAMAANGVGNNMSNIAALPAGALSIAVLPIIARYIGKGEHQQARKMTSRLMVISYGLVLLSGTLVYALASPLAAFFTAGQPAELIVQMHALIMQVTLIHTIILVTLWPLSFLVPAALRAAGDVKYVTAVSVPSMLIARVGIGFVCAKVLNLGVPGIWLGMAADWLIRSVFFSLRFRGKKWLSHRVI